MTQETKDKIKYHLHSSAITFLTAFFFAFAPLVQNIDITSSLEVSGVFGVALAICRALIKPLYQSIWAGFVSVVAWITTKLKK